MLIKVFSVFLYFQTSFFAFDYPALSFLFDLSNKQDDKIKAYEFQPQINYSKTFENCEKIHNEWKNIKSTTDFLSLKKRSKKLHEGLPFYGKK